MKKPKFLRRNWNKYKRLGLRNKKKLKWQRPRGKHSKMRKRRVGYPIRVETGYRTALSKRGKISGMIPVLVRNVDDLQKLNENNAAIVAHVGQRKREAIIKKANEMKIKLLNAG